MATYYSLDDDDDAASSAAGPSRLGESLEDRLSPRRNGTRSSVSSSSNVNPIAAMLYADRRKGSAFEEEQEDEEASNVLTKDVKQRPRFAPVVELRYAWANERAAPVLLPWQGDAVDGVCSQIEEQMHIVDSLASDAATAEEEHVRLGLVELDVERARWLLRSYLRCRIDKIEQHAAFVCDDPESRNNLSELERGYAVKYAQVCSQHFHSSTLDFLPENMRSLDDKAAASSTSGRGDMVTQPDKDAPVFVRCREDCGTFRFPGVDVLVQFKKDSIHFVRFRTIEHLIANGKAELL